VTRPLPPADYSGCPITVTEAIAEGRELRAPRWGLWDAVWAAIAALVIGLVAATVFTVIDAPVAVLILVGTTLPWLALGGWPLIVTRWRGNGPRIDLGLRLTWSDTGWGVLAGFSGLLLAGIAALITQLFAPDVTSAAAEAADQLQESAGRLAITVFALLVMVGAPIVEELFFRGLLFSALRKRGLGAVLTIVISALLFAGFHFEPTRFFVLLPTGLLLGWVRWKTGSTGSSMVAHGVVNAPGALVLLLGIPDVTP
jgi:membrane protease YdiL (CAAX protease family)